MHPLVYWIWLSLRCGAGSELGSILLERFGSPKAIYELDERALGAISALTPRQRQALCDHSTEREKLILSYCERTGIGILTPEDGAYPSRLRAIYAKPLVLYYMGTLPAFDDGLQIACVGTRTCSHNGRGNAFCLGYDLALSGAVVVSGMARGIDTAAHYGALAAGGRTVAVLGCGMDHVYPPENRNLMREIAKHGTLITEFAPGCAPNAKNFPIRNRIISGLSQGTLVVEADLRSGSLITARSALRQGRDIFACPGGVGDSLSVGTNALIREGARLTTSAFDVLAEYESLYPHRIFTERLLTVGAKAKRDERLTDFMRGYGAEPSPAARETDIHTTAEKTEKKKRTPPARQQTRQGAPSETAAADHGALSETERTVLSLITREISCEELALLYAKQTGRNADMAELLGVLTMLEMGGYIEARPGGSFAVPVKP